MPNTEYTQPVEHTEEEMLEEYIKQYLALNESLATLESAKDELKLKITIAMKTKNLDRFEDKSNNIVSISRTERETLDKDLVLKEVGMDKYKEFIKTTKVETMRIISANNRERMKEFMTRKQK